MFLHIFPASSMIGKLSKSKHFFWALKWLPPGLSCFVVATWHMFVLCFGLILSLYVISFIFHIWLLIWFSSHSLFMLSFFRLQWKIPHSFPRIFQYLPHLVEDSHGFPMNSKPRFWTPTSGANARWEIDRPSAAPQTSAAPVHVALKMV